MRDLETIIVLVVLAFSFIPRRVHHTLPCLDYDSETLKQLPSHQGTAQQPPEWSRHTFDRRHTCEQTALINAKFRIIVHSNIANHEGVEFEAMLVQLNIAITAANDVQCS